MYSWKIIPGKHKSIALQSLTPCSKCSQFAWILDSNHNNGGGDPVISAELTFKSFSEGNCGQYFPFE